MVKPLNRIALISVIAAGIAMVLSLAVFTVFCLSGIIGLNEKASTAFEVYATRSVPFLCAIGLTLGVVGIVRSSRRRGNVLGIIGVVVSAVFMIGSIVILLLAAFVVAAGGPNGVV